MTTTRRNLLLTGASSSLTLVTPQISRAAAGAASIQPTRLSVEQLPNPQGLDTRQPRLSWQCRPAAQARRGAGQTAYQVLVAPSLDELAARRDLLWDTGKVVSANNLLLPYQGAPLSPGQICHWQVTVWDGNDQSATSASARWSMGLGSEDWTADWIGAPPEQPVLLQADWIGYDSVGPYGPGHGDTTPGYTQYFRRQFYLQDGVAPGAGEMHLVVDGVASIFVNGNFAGTVQGTDGMAATRLALPALPRGPCVLALQIGHPADIERTPALMARTVLHRLDGGETSFGTDTGWRVSDWAPDGWRSPGFDESGWLPARRLPASPVRPAVAAPSPVTEPAVMLRREFTPNSPVRRAWLQASGLGWSEILVNGNHLGDAVLSPPLADYARRIPGVMHEVTPLLQPGVNVVGVLLGRGRYAAPRSDARHFGAPRLRLQLMLDYADGTRGVVGSDAAWTVTTQGPLRTNN